MRSRPRSGSRFAPTSRRLPHGPGARPASASCSSARIRRRRSTSATRFAPAAIPACASTSNACPRRPASTSFWRLVERLNRSDAHDGILVQAPLPAAMGKGAAQRVFDAIDPAKDVDGFNPVSVGRLVQGRALLAPCTPSGVIEMLDRSGIRDRGIARGRHRPQRDRRQADGHAAAAPRRHRDDLPFQDARPAGGARRRQTSSLRRSAAPASSRKDFVKPGATVIDVGINRVTDRGAGAVAVRRGLDASRRLRSARVGRRG